MTKQKKHAKDVMTHDHVSLLPHNDGISVVVNDAINDDDDDDNDDDVITVLASRNRSRVHKSNIRT